VFFFFLIGSWCAPFIPIDDIQVQEVTYYQAYDTT